MLENVKIFLKEGLWESDYSQEPKHKKLFYSALRIFIRAGQGFQKDHCVLRASALTFYTLLSLVPVLAMAFGIAKGFGLEAALEKQIENSMGAHGDVTEKLIEFSHSMLDNTKGGLVAGVGILMLFWSIIKVLGHIETSMNAVWNIEKPRSWTRKISEYLAVMIMGPILIILSSGATIFITSQVKHLSESFDILDYVGPFIFFLIKLTPYIVVWLLFTFLYLIMPNTKVKIKSALLAGIIAGTLFQFVEWGYINFQVGAVSYNKVYGSFAALPLFLVWMQISWMIVLFGSEVSYHIQTAEQFGTFKDKHQIPRVKANKIALLITRSVVNNFKEHGPLLSVVDLSETLKLPRFATKNSLDELVKANLLSTTLEEGKIKYQPKLDPDLLTTRKVLDEIEKLGEDLFELTDAELMEGLINKSKADGDNQALKNL